MRGLTKTFTAIAVLALAAAGCNRSTPTNQNPLAPNTSNLVSTGVKMILDEKTLWASNMAATPTPGYGLMQYRVYPKFYDGTADGCVEYQCGGTGYVFTNSPGLDEDTFFSLTTLNWAWNIANGVRRVRVYSGSYGLDSSKNWSFLRLYGRGNGFYFSPSHGKTATKVDDALGVGGPNGDYDNDFYIRWAGHKVGGNTSTDYANITYYFKSLRSPHPPVDLSKFHGFTFYARGHGNFGVGLNAGANGGPPYKDYNVFEKVFGDQLVGDDQWRQIVVYFTDMQQLFLGKGYVDINEVLASCSGLQFQQENPVTADFQLDLDYIRFF